MLPTICFPGEYIFFFNSNPFEYACSPGEHILSFNTNPLEYDSLREHILSFNSSPIEYAPRGAYSFF